MYKSRQKGASMKRKPLEVILTAFLLLFSRPHRENNFLTFFV